MSYEIEFKSPNQAMKFAVEYNKHAVKVIIKAIKYKKIKNASQAEFLFSFAGINGYPVKCFCERYQLK